MPRPFLVRTVRAVPSVAIFKPAGVPARGLVWVELALDEYEAIRLIDGAGLDQQAAAGRMGVSRPTVTRILAAARAKVARMLTEGAALVIRGGPVVAPGPGRRGRGWAPMPPVAPPAPVGTGFMPGAGRRRGRRFGRGGNGR